jgi:trans-2,3-dihydro-3-hydroxyanthranilate isomerase
VTAFRYTIVDVFTDLPLAGNQLAVFTDARELPEALLQPLAREVSFSETVFVLPPERGGHARIRIFTPTLELPFAGHPTLGSAFVLGGPLQADELVLEVGGRLVPVRLEREGPKLAFAWMEQPVPPWERYARAGETLAALGVERATLPVERYHLGPSHILVGLESREQVAALAPDREALGRLDAPVFCFAGDGGRWKARMFGPTIGIAEDPATGSAAGPLAIHLARHGRIAWGDEIEISQGAEVERPSTLHARAEGEGERVDRLEVGGSAVLVARGQFQL